MSKFIKQCADDISCQEFALSERARIIAAFELQDRLESIKNEPTPEELAELLSKEGFCLKTLSKSFICPESNGCKDCNRCWLSYIKRETRLFRRTVFYAAMHGEEGEAIVRKVKSKEYLNWICDYLDRHSGALDSEVALYASQAIDAENAKWLHVFLMYISDLVAETDIEDLANPKECELERYHIKVNDKYLDICEIVGQGSVLFINEMRKEPQNFLEVHGA